MSQNENYEDFVARAIKLSNHSFRPLLAYAP